MQQTPNDIMLLTLHDDVHRLITSAKTKVAQIINRELVSLNWNIGQRILQEILKDARADYGQEIMSRLAKQLTQHHGVGFSRTNLFHMVRFAQAYPDNKIVYALSRQLGWTHFRKLIYIENDLKRQFYTEMCRLELWSTRTLDKKLESMLYERTAIAQKPEAVIANELEQLQTDNQLSPDLVFRDPYVLDFLKLPNFYSETDLENAILDELSAFLQELGTDFCFVARQKRIVIDNEDYALDLLFYHRGLRRLIAIELKLGKFKAADKGQMELYLRWLEKYEKRAGEASPLGLILCSEKKQEHVELLELDKSGIHVAQYLTKLPDLKLLEQKLHRAIQVAKDKMEQHQKQSLSENDAE